MTKEMCVPERLKFGAEIIMSFSRKKIHFLENKIKCFP